MGTILSAISGQFTRSLILGTFFPVVLFLVLGLITVVPLLPPGLPVLATFQHLDNQWQIVAFTFGAVVLAGFLYILNIPILRFYEGYPWSDSWIARWRTSHYRKRYQAARELVPRLRFLRDAWKTIPGSDTEVEKLHDGLSTLGLLLTFAYPSQPGLILPTRFGNVIRSSEAYPFYQYGMDAIAFWPQLTAVAGKDALAEAAESKSSVDCFVNCSLLSALLAVLLAGVGFATTGPSMEWDTLLRWPIEAAAAAFFSYLFYVGAVSRAAGWGGEIRSLFDLYRWDLLKKLGYYQKPATRFAERDLWGAITRQVLYGDPPIDPPLPYRSPRAKPRAKPVQFRMKRRG